MVGLALGSIARQLELIKKVLNCVNEEPKTE